MKGDMNASVRLSMRKVQESQEELKSITTELPAQVSTQRIISWRNSVEGLQKQMDGHSKYLKSLAKDAPSSHSAFSPTLENFLRSLEKLESDFKTLIGMLRNLAYIPRSCEYSTWDLILSSLITELQKAAAAVVTHPNDESFKIAAQVYAMRDSLISQVLMALEHRKIVLWMDLGIMETGYVRGEILDSVTKIVQHRDEHGYIPLKIPYVHPRVSELPQITANTNTNTGKLDLVSMISTFNEEFLTVIALIENNFKLNTKMGKRSPKAKSLRAELEKACEEREKLEQELQKARIQNRNPDKREWFQFKREFDEKEQQLKTAQRQLQKLNMDKSSLESEGKQLKERIKHLETNLAQVTEVYMPRLTEVQKLHSELNQTVKQVRQDAELLPSMFRNEAEMKMKIRDEKISTEAKMHKTAKELRDKCEENNLLKEQLTRKEKIAIHAIGARNALEDELKIRRKEIEELKKAINEQEQLHTHMHDEVQNYIEKHDKMQQHVYVQNNRINELEDQKKVLMKQVKEAGNHSEAHFTYKMVRPK